MNTKMPPRKPVADVAPDAVPRMVSASDIGLVATHAAGLLPGALALEFGPWLGALSIFAAQHAHLVAVDNFLWTKDHDRRLPGTRAIGASFRPEYERNLRIAGVSVEVVETDFADFTWDGRAVHLCIIDAPKTAGALADLLARVWTSLAPEATMIVKNAANPDYPGMKRFLDHLVDRTILRLSDRQGEGTCNSRAYHPGPAFATLPPAEALSTEFLVDAGSALPGSQDDLARVFLALTSGNLSQAYMALDRLAPSTDHLAAWERFERSAAQRSVGGADLDIFAEVFVLHNDRLAQKPATEGFHRSQSKACQAYWINAAGKPWRGQGMQPAIFKRAAEFGYMHWPNNIQDHVRGRDVLDVGCGPGLHGIGYLIAGARSYLGLDPIIKPNNDVVKNTAARTKESFGWTPNDLMALMPAWKVAPKLTSSLTEDAAFDVVTLHNVTEHLLQLEEVLIDVRRLLRPGGIMIYNHHNFFSWNGHHLPPKSVEAIVPGDPAQKTMMDWAHLDYQPEPGHYIARGLNRLRLDAVIAITRRHFQVVQMDEIPSRPAVGSDRLTDNIRARHPQLSDRDFLTQNLFCIARKT